MSRNHVYILFVTVCVAVVVAAEVMAPEPVDWTPTFIHDDTRPLGSRILYEQLPPLFGEGAVHHAEAPLARTLAPERVVPRSYVFVSSTFAPHDLEVGRLLEYAAAGGDVFAAAETFGGLLADTLNLAVGPRAATADSVELHFVSPALGGGAYRLRPDLVRGTFASVDTSWTAVLAVDGDGAPVLVRTAFGDGAFYLSSTPHVFTNYAMLQGSAGYVYRALSYLPEGSVWWDGYYKPVRTQATTPLRYVLSDEALRWAYFVGLGTLLLFVVTQARRRQRSIPVEEPPENATRAFAETVGRLYYRHGDHADLAQKKVAYFHDYLRHRLNVRVRRGEDDALLVDDVAERSGVPRDEVDAVFEAVREAEARGRLSEKELLRLTRRIDAFYEHSVR